MNKKTDSLKIRMANVKGSIPVPYMSVYEYVFGVQNEKQRSRIHEVWNLRAADLEIVSNFEKIARKSKQTQKTNTK